MNNDFDQQFPREQPQSQYGQPQWEQPSQYGPPQFPQGQQQWGQQQYGQPQPQQFSQGYGQQYPPVPEYARAQPNDNNTTNTLLFGWLAYRAVVRVVVPIVIVLLMLGACVFFGLLSAVLH